MQKGQKFWVCPNCKTVNIFTEYIEIKTEEDLLTYGLECKNCKVFVYGYWKNKKLLELEEVKFPDRKHRRKYKHKFSKFQRKQRKKYGLYTDKIPETTEDEYKST